MLLIINNLEAPFKKCILSLLENDIACVFQDVGGGGDDDQRGDDSERTERDQGSREDGNSVSDEDSRSRNSKEAGSAIQ